ncbi:hypothetical protein [Ekhidna sp.]|uniref:hypothetical protein n=1 Tax=Ekhidna sp. TaxID=2608089 RepID=UPI003297BE1C
MKKPILIFVSLFAFQLAIGQSMKDFKWLEVTWERQNVNPGTTAYEVWKKIDQGFEGLGVSLKGNDTTFVEKLWIVEKDSDFYYVADVKSNPEPTYFKITSISKNGFVSENPQHDFPKKIEYSLEGNKMTVVISAGEKAMGFVFVRME